MLTPKEEQVMQFITRHIAGHGRAPTLEEIGGYIGVASRGTVHRYVKALENKGHLQRASGWRGLRLTGEGPRASHWLPLAGRVSAGNPIQAIPDQEAINFPEMLLGADRYVLKVQGDSMIEAGIFDGDYVVIKYAETARSGDIVMALIDNEEATIKRYRPHRGRIELVPANAKLTAVTYAPERVQIQGIVVAKVGFF